MLCAGLSLSVKGSAGSFQLYWTAQWTALPCRFVDALQTPVANAPTELGLLLQTAEQPATGEYLMVCCP